VIVPNAGAARPKEAVRWLEAAARQSDAESMNFLGMIYSQDLGVRKDVVEAYKWWMLGAQRGNMDAAGNLAKLKGLLTAEQRMEAQSRAASFGVIASTNAGRSGAGKPPTGRKMVWGD
jgi:TPR repeat protein